MAELAFKFWERVDGLRENISLGDLSQAVGINYATLRDMRSRNRYPKNHHIIAIANYLNTSVSYLMTGKEDSLSAFCPEAEYVRKNALARELIKYCMMDEEVLSSCAALARLAAGKRMDVLDRGRKA